MWLVGEHVMKTHYTHSQRKLERERVPYEVNNNRWLESPTQFAKVNFCFFKSLYALFFLQVEINTKTQNEKCIQRLTIKNLRTTIYICTQLFMILCTIFAKPNSFIGRQSRLCLISE